MAAKDESKECRVLEEKNEVETTAFYDWRRERRRHTIHIATKIADFVTPPPPPPPPFDWTKIDGRASFDWAKAANVRDHSPQKLSFLLKDAVKESTAVLKEKPGFDWADKWLQESSKQKQVPSFDWDSVRRQRLRKTKSFSDALDVVVGIIPTSNNAASKRGKPQRGPPSFDWTNERFDWTQQSPRYDWSQSARFANERITKDQIPVNFDRTKSARMSATPPLLPSHHGKSHRHKQHKKSPRRENSSDNKGDKQPTIPRRRSISS